MREELGERTLPPSCISTDPPILACIAQRAAALPSVVDGLSEVTAVTNIPFKNSVETNKSRRECVPEVAKLQHQAEGRHTRRS